MADSRARADKMTQNVPWSAALCHALSCCPNLKSLTLKGSDSHEDDLVAFAEGVVTVMTACRKVLFALMLLVGFLILV